MNLATAPRSACLVRKPCSVQRLSLGGGSRSAVAAMAQKHAAQQVVVRPVESQQQLDDFRRVTRAYLEWLGEDLSFQQIEAELASLPGSYAADAGGCMLLAYAPAGAGGDASSSSSSSDGSSDGDAGGAGGAAGVGPSSSGGGASGEEVIGAVALRRLVGHTPTMGPGDSLEGVPMQHVCEMKRLFVLEHHHGLGAGAALARALLGAAAGRGYRLMVLDTLERLEGANRLYSRLGFQPCQRYNDCPLPGVLYFARPLQGGEPGGADGGSGP